MWPNDQAQSQLWSFLETLTCLREYSQRHLKLHLKSMLSFCRIIGSSQRFVPGPVLLGKQMATPGNLHPAAVITSRGSLMPL